MSTKRLCEVLTLDLDQAVQEFFSSNEVTCTHCDQQIRTKEVLSGSENAAATENTAAPTSSKTSTSADSEDLAEAKELLKKVNSRSDEEIK
jgi:exopolysaccharide biosynthesis protein